MIDIATTWLLTYPLAGVGVLVAFAIGFGTVMIPRKEEVVTHGHPRC